MCKTSNLAQVETQLDEEKFLGILEQFPVSVKDNPWEVTLQVPVVFKIDTGADNIGNSIQAAKRRDSCQP